MLFKNITLCFIASTLIFATCKNSNTPAEGAPVAAQSQSRTDLYKKYNLDKIVLPQGFSISVYAEVPNARSICWGAKGTLFVGNRAEDNVYAVKDENNDGTADKVYKIASGLNTPNGVAFKNGSLYVALIDKILRYDDIEDNLTNPPKAVVVTTDYPDKAHHGWKFIAFGPDGKLYVPVGAPCNICESKDPQFASITRINADGSGKEIYASGIRNSVGFAWNPETKEMWFTENGRDMLGDDIPGDELNIAPQPGMHFGYPYCHQGNTLDPEFGKGKKCEDYTAPAKILDPHVAALGMRFYTGNSFPASYKNQIFIAEHGSWNRSTPIGYRVMLVTYEGKKVTGYKPFATGFLQGDKVNGRPVDIEITPDGSLLVSDDQAGAIYKISYKG